MDTCSACCRRTDDMVVTDVNPWRSLLVVADKHVLSLRLAVSWVSIERGVCGVYFYSDGGGIRAGSFLMASADGAAVDRFLVAEGHPYAVDEWSMDAVYPGGFVRQMERKMNDDIRDVLGVLYDEFDGSWLAEYEEGVSPVMSGIDVYIKSSKIASFEMISDHGESEFYVWYAGLSGNEFSEVFTRRSKELKLIIEMLGCKSGADLSKLF